MEIEFISDASSKFEKVYLYNNEPGKMQENTKYFYFTSSVSKGTRIMFYFIINV